MPKISKRLVDALQPRAGDDVFLWDSELRGFGVRMKQSGRAAFIVQYRTPQGRTRRYAFARVGTSTPDQARTMARRLLALVESGGDPSARRRATCQAVTVAELCERYLDAARTGLVTVRGKPKRLGTVRQDEGRIVHHIIPLIGSTPAKDIDRATGQRMVDAIPAGKTAVVIRKTKPLGHAVISGGGGAAARAAELLGGIWTWAERRGYVQGANPVHRIEKARRAPKDRVLSPEALTRLGAVLRGQAATQSSGCSPLPACVMARAPVFAGPRSTSRGRPAA
jgi:Arm DNA-binding domain